MSKTSYKENIPKYFTENTKINDTRLGSQVQSADKSQYLGSEDSAEEDRFLIQFVSICRQFISCCSISCRKLDAPAVDNASFSHSFPSSSPV